MCSIFLDLLLCKITRFFDGAGYIRNVRRNARKGNLNKGRLHQEREEKCEKG
jgi:hypothetical protein